jgi:hypothetical protein
VKFCSECGYKVYDDTAKFCSNCGIRVNQDINPNQKKSGEGNSSSSSSSPIKSSHSKISSFKNTLTSPTSTLDHI